MDERVPTGRDIRGESWVVDAAFMFYNLFDLLHDNVCV